MVWRRASQREESWGRVRVKGRGRGRGEEVKEEVAERRDDGEKKERKKEKKGALAFVCDVVLAFVFFWNTCLGASLLSSSREKAREAERFQRGARG